MRPVRRAALRAPQRNSADFHETALGTVDAIEVRASESLVGKPRSVMVGLKGKRVGDILVELGAIDGYEAQAAVTHARLRGIPSGQAFVELGLCDDDMLLRALALQLGSTVVDLSAVCVTSDVLAQIPASVALESDVLPLKRIRNARGRDTLVVAVAHPKNPALDELAFTTGCRIAPVLVSESALTEALTRHYRIEPSASGEVFLGDGPGLSHVVARYFDR